MELLSLGPVLTRRMALQPQMRGVSCGFNLTVLVDRGVHVLLVVLEVVRILQVRVFSEILVSRKTF